MKEVNTILEMLIESRTQLLEAKVRLKEREAEIDKDLSDCEIAIAALTPKVEVAAEQPQEPTDRVPKVGDVLVAKDDVKDLSVYFTPSKEYKVMENNGVPIICDDIAVLHSLPQEFWSKYFRFANEQTSEDLANLHSYLHVNGEAKKPYRIKTWDEMVNTEGCSMSRNGIVHPKQYDFNFNYLMEHLCGQPLDHNGKQYIEHYVIEPWMITENK